MKVEIAGGPGLRQMSVGAWVVRVKEVVVGGGGVAPGLFANWKERWEAIWVVSMGLTDDVGKFFGCAERLLVGGKTEHCKMGFVDVDVT